MSEVKDKVQDAPKKIDENPLQAELDALRAENEKLRAIAEDPNKPKAISGSYKGYSFAPGHLRVRNAQGELCDTEKLLAAAQVGDAEACAILDRLIEIEYAYFTK